MGLFNKLFGSGEDGGSDTKINWEHIHNMDELELAIVLSNERPVALFKHSTRCSISSMAKNRLERAWDFEEGQGPAMYFLDLIAYRKVSNAIAEQLGVRHESPQIILLKDEAVIYHSSHSAISIEALKKALEA